MKPERAVLLRDLLEEVMSEGNRIPDEIWWTFLKLAVLPYNELVIPRIIPGTPARFEFLLTRREENDPEWPERPWHIPGSLWRPWRLDPATKRRVPIGQREACRLVASEEVGIAVNFVTQITTHFWGFDFNHRYPETDRYPLSLVCVCSPLEPVIETSDRRFFGLDDLPEPMVPNHARFLRECENFLKTV